MKTAEVIDEPLIPCELCTMLAEQEWGHNGPRDHEDDYAFKKEFVFNGQDDFHNCHYL